MDDDYVGVECFDVLCGVVEGFVFCSVGVVIVEGDDVGVEVFGGYVESYVCVGVGFEEEVDDGFIVKGGDFFYVVVEDFFEGGGGGVDLVDFGE